MECGKEKVYEKTREMLHLMGMPTKLSELDIDDRYFGDMGTKSGSSRS